MHNHPVKSAQKIEYNLKKLARFAVDAETRDHADDAAKERRRRREGREEERTVARRRSSRRGAAHLELSVVGIPSLPPSLPSTRSVFGCRAGEEVERREERTSIIMIGGR